MTDTSVEIVKDLFNLRKHSSKIKPINQPNDFEMVSMEASRALKELSDDFDDDDDDEYSDEKADTNSKKNILYKIKLRIKVFYKASLSNPLVKKILILIVLSGYLVYFGISLYLNDPFKFLKNDSSSSGYIYDNYIFSNNRGKCLTLFSLKIT